MTVHIKCSASFDDFVAAILKYVSCLMINDNLTNIDGDDSVNQVEYKDEKKLHDV